MVAHLHDNDNTNLDGARAAFSGKRLAAALKQMHKERSIMIERWPADEAPAEDVVRQETFLISDGKAIYRTPRHPDLAPWLDVFPTDPEAFASPKVTYQPKAWTTEPVAPNMIQYWLLQGAKTFTGLAITKEWREFAGRAGHTGPLARKLYWSQPWAGAREDEMRHLLGVYVLGMYMHAFSPDADELEQFRFASSYRTAPVRVSDLHGVVAFIIPEYLKELAS